MSTTGTPTKEHPILFNAEMVRATLAGRKRQTRRVITPQNSLFDGNGIRKWPDGLDWTKVHVDPGPSPAGNPGPYLKIYKRDTDTWHRIYPRVWPGDGIWVREAWRESNSHTWEGCQSSDAVHYKADFYEPPADGCWKPSIHMPRWACRITLDVTAVRAERIQDISDLDAQAEGAACVGGSLLRWMNYRPNFAVLWETIYAPRGFGWETNPYVWVYEFKQSEEQ